MFHRLFVLFPLLRSLVKALNDECLFDGFERGQLQATKLCST